MMVLNMPKHDPKLFKEFWDAFTRWHTVTYPRIQMEEFNKPLIFSRFLRKGGCGNL